MLREFIFLIAERQFKKYKKTSPSLSPSLQSEYETSRENIDTLLRQTKYWHGTGRYQYRKQGDSKYAGVSKSETVDVLKETIEADGLKPHYDPWAEKYVRIPYSLSLANQWGYGKMYAHYHLNEKERLLYEIAPIRFWYRLIIWIQLTENYCKFALGFLIWYTFSKSLQKQGKVWLSTFRSDTNKKWPFWKILTAQSDIPNNYSILFGVCGGISTLEIPKILRFLETRTNEPITFDKITFVSVPLKNTSETETFLKNAGIHLKIIPLESLETHMRQYTIKEIMTQEYSYLPIN